MRRESSLQRQIKPQAAAAGREAMRITPFGSKAIPVMIGDGVSVMLMIDCRLRATGCRMNVMVIVSQMQRQTQSQGQRNQDRERSQAQAAAVDRTFHHLDHSGTKTVSQAEVP